MSTLVVYSSTSDGSISSYDDYDDDYAGARAGTGAGGLSVSTGSVQGGVGQANPDLDQNEVQEGFISFDTSSIASGDTVSAATLNLTSAGDSSQQDFDIQARDKDWGTTLSAADWVAPGSYGTLRAHRSTSSGWTSSTAYDLTDDAMAAGVVKAGSTRLVLISSRTVAGLGPDTDAHIQEYVSFYTGDQSGTTSDPKLTVTYTEGGGSSGTTNLPGTAHQPTTGSGPAPAAASGTGTAQTPTASVRTPAGLAAASGTAHQPTVQTFAATNAQAGLASGTATVSGATAADAPMAAAGTASGTAPAPEPRVHVFPAAASGTGTAQAPTVQTVALPTTDAPAGLASATGTAHQPTVTAFPLVEAHAGLASGVAAAWGGVAALGAMAGTASGTGTAGQVTGPTVSLPVTGHPIVRPPLKPRPKRPEPELDWAPNVFAFAGVARGEGRAHSPSTRLDFPIEEALLGLSDEQLGDRP